jgi:methylthioribose-1-phosphate isomerase
MTDVSALNTNGDERGGRSLPEVLEWIDGCLRLVDQRALPDELTFLDCRRLEDVAHAIRTLAVRGAPAIGIAAAYGVIVGLLEGRDMEETVSVLASTRPTAVNLFWALERMKRAAVSSETREKTVLAECLLREARAIHEEDIENNRRMGDFGQSLLPAEGTVLTHCNAGALATGGYGTALGVLRSARAVGKKLRIYAGETRPLMQGARLTAWELDRDGFDVTLICDSMAAALMRTRSVDAVFVGADRIAANGDTANKIGTYGLALIARCHEVPFYVAAPSGTLDPTLASGKDIPIEERDLSEIRALPNGKRVPERIPVWNPAFDVTPSDLITSIVTEKGIFCGPYHF